MSKILFLDLETTGFSREWDYIIEVAAVLYDDESNIFLEEFHEYIKPNKMISAKITELTGITNEQVFNCRSEFEVLSDFLEWVHIINPDVIVGHNYNNFDGDFLKKKANRYNIGINLQSEVVDTLVLARKLTKEGKLSVINHKQPTLANHFNVIYQAHSAIEDTKALVKIYKKLKELETGREHIKINRQNLGF